MPFQRLLLFAGVLGVVFSGCGHAGSGPSMTEEPAVVRSPKSLIEGQVLDSEGRPVAGAEVVARFYAHHTGRTTSGPGGRFAIEVGPGTYLVTAFREGQAGAQLARITVSEGERVQGVTVRLSSSRSLVGQVISRRTGNGVAKAHVVVQHDASRTSFDLEADEHGYFTAEGLTSGKYNLFASAIGYARQQLAGVDLSSPKTSEVRLELTRLGTIEGVVRDTDGKPAMDVYVSVRMESGKSRLAYNESGIAIEAIGRPTDAEGHYRIPDVAGRVRLSLQRWDQPIGEEKLVEVPEDDTRVVDFVVPPPPLMGFVEGTVRRPGGGALGSSILINAAPGKASHRGYQAGPDGKFRLELPVGTHTLTAQDEGNGWGPPRTVTIEAGKTTTADVELRVSIETRGVLVTPEGRPAAGASIIGSFDEGVNNRTDEQGRFVLKSAPETAGQVGEIWFSLGAMTAWARDIKVGSQGLRIPLQPAAVLKGRVVGDGAPVQGFLLRVEDIDDGPPYYGFSPVSREFTDDRFQVGELLALPVAVLVRTFDGRTGKARVVLEPGRENEVEVRLGGVGRIQGRLVESAEGVRRAGRWIQVDLDSKQKRRVYSDETGHFELVGLDPGPHVLFVGPGEGQGRLVERRFELRAGESLDLGDIPVPAPTPRKN